MTDQIQLKPQSAANRRTALDCLRQEGMECEVIDPVWLAKAKRGEYFVDLITGMSNGVIVVEAPGSSEPIRRWCPA